MIVAIDNAPDTYIGASKIEGQGLIATDGFNKGEIILDYRPFIHTFYKIKWSDLSVYQCNHNWLVPIDDDYCLTSDLSSKIFYVNHSRSPNANWYIKDYIITASTDIKPNEEITIDYRLELRPNRGVFPDWI